MKSIKYTMQKTKTIQKIVEKELICWTEIPCMFFLCDNIT